MDAKELGAMPANAAPGEPWVQDGLIKSPFDGFGWMIDPQPGITLRQHYAGLAMQGAMADGEVIDFDAFSNYCVKAADALLAELAKEPQP